MHLYICVFVHIYMSLLIPGLRSDITARKKQMSCCLSVYPFYTKRHRGNKDARTDCFVIPTQASSGLQGDPTWDPARLGRRGCHHTLENSIKLWVRGPKAGTGRGRGGAGAGPGRDRCGTGAGQVRDKCGTGAGHVRETCGTRAGYI